MFPYTIEATNGRTCRHKADDQHHAADQHVRMHLRVQGTLTVEQTIGRNTFYRFTRKGFPLAKTFAVRASN